MINKVIPHFGEGAKNRNARFWEMANVLQTKLLPFAQRINEQDGVLHIYIEELKDEWNLSGITQELWMEISENF